MKNYKMDVDKVKNALLWIQSILERADVPYQIVGGLAAYIYGAQRPIADIDLYIPNNDVLKLEDELAAFISKPLQHYIEEGWDLEYMQLIYKGQKIEIGLVPGVKLQQKNGDWVNQTIDFTTSVMSEFEGVRLPLMPKVQLIQYKTILSREVDIFDIQAIS